MKSGFVSIVGRPNVGKSTLLNKILGEKVSIVSKVPQTTRNQVRGIYSDERGQIVFVDTPGMHLGRDRLDKYMNQAVTGSVDNADCIIYLADITRRVGKEEDAVARKVFSSGCPVIVGFNKVDLQKSGEGIPEYIAFLEKILGKSLNETDRITLLPLSAERGTNIDKLLDLLFEILPEGPALYPEDVLTDTPQRLAISDIIREKLFQSLKQEIPHSVGVLIEHMQPKKTKTLHIKALIVVERDTQKQIVIGKGGEFLKKIATQARQDLEHLLESKVFLEIFVKVEKNWRDRESVLQDFGYSL